MPKTKVAICIPTRVSPRSIWFKHFSKWLNYMNGQDRYAYKLFVMADPTNNVGVVRENLLNTVLADGTCEYMLWIDDDVMPPMDVIDQMLDSGKDIATGIYWSRDTTTAPLIQKYPDGENVRYEYYKHEEEPIFRVLSCGFGCFWIKADRILYLTKPRFWMTSGVGFGEDIHFCLLLQNAAAYYTGFELYAIGTCVCRHIFWKHGQAELLPDNETWEQVNAKYNKTC